MPETRILNLFSIHFKTRGRIPSLSKEDIKQELKSKQVFQPLFSLLQSKVSIIIMNEVIHGLKCADEQKPHHGLSLSSSVPHFSSQRCMIHLMTLW